MLFRRKVSWLISLLVVTAAAEAVPPSVEQLRGRVVDENDLPVPGVEIVFRAPDGQARTTYTDEAGHFELPSLGAGDYRVSLNKPGFFRLADYPVQIQEGVNEISFTLRHESEIREKVEVISSTNRVAPQETAHQETLVAHEIRDIPVPSTHDLGNSLAGVPGVVRDNSGQLHVAGARGGETQFLLDGFEIGDPATGDLTFRVNVDTVRAVVVETGRYSAQYAHAGAGVLALDTSVGDDRWRFGATNFIPGISLQHGTPFGHWFPRFTFSGPLRRGRVWFSEAASLQHTLNLRSEQPDNAETAQWAGDNLLRVQINLTPAHVFQGSFLYNQLSASHLGLGPFSPLSTATSLKSHRYFVSLKDQIWFRSTLVEVGLAADGAYSERWPLGLQPYVLTPTGTAGNFFESLRQRTRRWQFIGNLSMPSRHWHGFHDLQAGLNVDGIVFAHVALRNTIEVQRLDATLLQRRTFFGLPEFRLSNTRVGAYVQDSWRLARPLLVQFGMRADWDRIFQLMLVAPRVSANFLPFHDDRAKLAIAWGIYYQPIDLALLGQGLDQHWMDVIFDDTGKNPVLGPVVGHFALTPASLRQPRFCGTSVEWVQKVGGNTLAGIHLIYRDQRLGLAYEDLQPGQPGGFRFLGNNRRDRYRSFEIWLRHSFREKAELFGAYTRSRARSNEVLDYSLGDLLVALQAPGPLPWDVPNRFISWGWGPAPIWHLWLSYFFEYRTGFPFSVIDQQRQLVGSPNRLRFPDYLSLNVGVEKRFRFRGHEWAARLSLINATGHDNPTAVINNVDAPNFLTFAGGQGWAVTGRLRLIARK